MDFGFWHLEFQVSPFVSFSTKRISQEEYRLLKYNFCTLFEGSSSDVKLFEAAFLGNIPRIKYLLNIDANIHVCTENGLSLADFIQNIDNAADMIRFLISKDLEFKGVSVVNTVDHLRRSQGGSMPLRITKTIFDALELLVNNMNVDDAQKNQLVFHILKSIGVSDQESSKYYLKFLKVLFQRFPRKNIPQEITIPEKCFAFSGVLNYQSLDTLLFFAAKYQLNLSVRSYLLSESVLLGYPSYVKTLLNLGADPNTLDVHNMSPAVRAGMNIAKQPKNSLVIMKMLKTKYVDLNAASYCQMKLPQIIESVLKESFRNDKHLIINALMRLGMRFK